MAPRAPQLPRLDCLRRARCHSLHRLACQWLAALWLTAAVGALVAQAPSDSTRPLGEQELALLAMVSEEGMQERVRQLVALGPRMGGTPSGELAARARAKAFAAMKLESVAIDGPERLCHEEPHWRLMVHAEGTEPWELTSAWPWGFSPSARGRVPLSLEETDGSALLRARRPRGRIRKKSAIVLYDEETTADGRYPIVRHLRARPDNPYPVFGISTGQGARLRTALAAGEVQLEFELRATIRKARARTIIGSLPARAGVPPGFLLFCAHGDSDAGGPGANDNGSGEAIVLELARVLSEAVRSEFIPAPAMELRFAIWGSEIHSTRHYLDEVVPKDSAPILGVVNYDQSGFGSGSDQLNLEPDDVPANRALIELLTACLRGANGAHGLPERWATNKSLGGTDSYVFSGSSMFEQKMLPSITVYVSAWDHPEDHPRTPGTPGESWSDRDRVHVDYDLHYHSAGDTPENTTDTEAWNMGWCARVGILAAMRLPAR